MAYNFIHKLLHAEIPPPESAWDKIAAALEKSEMPIYVEKLSNASVAPPFGAWANISAALDASQSARKRGVIVSLMKWSAAAVVAALIIFSATYIFNSHSTGGDLAGNKPSENTDTTSSSNVEPSIVTTTRPGIPFKDATTLASNDLASNSDRDRAKKQKQMLLPVRHAVIEGPIVDNSSQLRQSQPNVSDNISPSSAKYIPPPDYYVVTAPNGEKTRISTKFSDGVVSLVGGDNVDYFWKSRFDNWKTKLISNPSFIPAAGNFLDIAELKDLIKEQ